MFKKIILSLLFVPLTALAQKDFMDSRPVMCGTPERVMETVSRFGERALLGGVAGLIDMQATPIGSSTVVLYVNVETMSFTIVEYLTRTEACIVIAGSQLNLDSKEIDDKFNIWMMTKPKPKGPTT